MLVLLGVHGYAPGIAPSTGRRAPRAHGWRLLRACASADASYIVRPPPSTPPRAIVHFLGGAFVGAAPQLAYARLLSELAADGLVVVATPYQLSFDYLALCERVLADFEPAHAALTEEYGALPLVGVGHSCGALLHVLICSLFAGGGGVASVPRAANALVSFNNKRAADAIPFFATLVAPVASGVAASPLPAAVASARGRLDALADEPAAAADADGAAATATAAPAASALAAARQLFPLVEQLPELLREIDDGRADFEPTPDETRRAAGALYAARRTLAVRFDDDALDESLVLPTTLERADLQLNTLRGTHLTPLTPAAADPLGLGLPPPPLPAAADAEFSALRRLLLRFVDDALAADAEEAARE